MTPELWTVLAVGVLIGYVLGRARAEFGRARYDGRKAMRGRKDWRR